MKPLALFIGPTLGLNYLFKALEQKGFDVKIFRDRSQLETAIAYAKEHGKEISLVVVNLDMPLGHLYEHEKEEGQHPFVVAYGRIMFFCEQDPLSVLLSVATDDPLAFGEMRDFPQPRLFINLMKTDAVKQAETIYQKYLSLKHAPTPPY